MQSCCNIVTWRALTSQSFKPACNKLGTSALLQGPCLVNCQTVAPESSCICGFDLQCQKKSRLLHAVACPPPGQAWWAAPAVPGTDMCNCSLTAWTDSELAQMRLLPIQFHCLPATGTLSGQARRAVPPVLQRQWVCIGRVLHWLRHRHRSHRWVTATAASSAPSALSLRALSISV